tara:strand:+ start:293 stop:502 length:210 start_codon:yes stop_codon:yes gene_type:complete
MTTVTDMIEQIDMLIEKYATYITETGGSLRANYEGRISGLEEAKKILLKGQRDGPRYFGYKSSRDTPLN